MPIYRGNTELSKVYLGATELSQIYLRQQELLGSNYELGLSSALISIPAQNDATWTLRSADISGFNGAQAYVVFRYINGSDINFPFDGDIQLDDFNLGGNSYDPETSTHSFETSTSNITTYSTVTWNALGTGTNNNQWNRDNLGTVSTNTGNTSGNTGDYYFYAETSGGATAGFYYWLRSPLITISSSTLSFYSAQNGSNCGSLEVYLDVTA